MAHLEALPLFQALSGEGRASLAACPAPRGIPAATLILHKGAPVSGAYVVVRGRLRIFSISPDGPEATLYTLVPGETCVLALNCLFQNLLYPAWVAAEEASEVAVIPGPLYRRLFEREPAIQNLTVQALSTSVFRLMRELEQVHFHKLEHRLASFLLGRASGAGELRMTQQDMASHLGAAREAVARLLASFAAAGMVETRRGRTLIRDAAALARLLAPGYGQPGQPG